jgi:hypothetical protein
MQSDERNGIRAGRSLEELTTPRPWGMPSPDVFDGALLKIEDRLRSSVPEELRKRIGVTRNLAVYGGFCYDFITVSVFWSFTCVEMALWAKFNELNPGPFLLVKKKDQITLPLDQLPGNLRFGWRIDGMPDFNGSFRSLVDWAISEKLSVDDGSLDAILKLRNSFAHEFSHVWSPPMAVDVFQKTIEIINHLWPLDLAPKDGSN